MGSLYPHERVRAEGGQAEGDEASEEVGLARGLDHGSFPAGFERGSPERGILFWGNLW